MGIMMADIHTPPLAPTPRYRQTYASRPTGAAIVTGIAGAWAIFNGYAVFMVGNYIPIFDIAMFIMMMGGLNMLLGFLEIFAGYRIYNFKRSAKGLGIVANIVLIVINLIIFAIGLIGMALCVISLIALGMANPNS
ncbi:MAG: hypothetical protein EAX87_14350 [Candidatus Thorarchaeota archaeon]|nr:hypothetical protein [Candidatus Thorarchaeota archaeon]